MRASFFLRDIASLDSFVLLALATAACARPFRQQGTRTPTMRSAPTGVPVLHPTIYVPRPTAFEWAGTYELIGTNFPEGVPMATRTIGRRDTGSVYGSRHK